MEIEEAIRLHSELYHGVKDNFGGWFNGDQVVAAILAAALIIKDNRKEQE